MSIAASVPDVGVPRRTTAPVQHVALGDVISESVGTAALLINPAKSADTTPDNGLQAIWIPAQNILLDLPANCEPPLSLVTHRYADDMCRLSKS